MAKKSSVKKFDYMKLDNNAFASRQTVFLFQSSVIIKVLRSYKGTYSVRASNVSNVVKSFLKSSKTIIGLPRKQLSVKRWSLVILLQDVLFMMTIELFEISDINIERKNYQKQLH